MPWIVHKSAPDIAGFMRLYQGQNSDPGQSLIMSSGMSDDESLPGDAKESDGGHEAGHEGAGDGQHPRPPVSHQKLQTCLLLTPTKPGAEK